MMPLGCYVRAHMHRRLFVAFGAAILLTGVAVALVMTVAGPHGPSWRVELGRVESFVGGRFARVWDDPAARSELADAMARDLDIDLEIRDAGGRSLATALAPRGPARGARGGVTHGPWACRRPIVITPAAPDGRALGTVMVCTDRHHNHGGAWRLGLALVAAWWVLWAMAGAMARRLSRPLTELVRVVQDVGDGRLASRIKLPRHHRDGDVARLAEAVNDMAARIERQMTDQRELLAAVSHEIRSPLARMRFMLEMTRDGSAPPGAFDELDRELVGIDALVGDLLANSRIDFGALSPVSLDAVEVAERALERSGLGRGLLVTEGVGDVSSGRFDGSFEGDATLVTCAVANLLENARKHGGGATALRVGRRDGRVVFEVDDRGAGFAPGEEGRVFEPFYRGGSAVGEKRAGVGLGLALVKRIAETHGGRAYARNLPGQGARVGIELADARSSRDPPPA